MTSERDTWFNDAACLTTDPDAFFPEHGDATTGPKARRICDGCDVTNQCLEYAITHRITDGIWGSTSPRTRRRIIEQRNKEAA